MVLSKFEVPRTNAYLDNSLRKEYGELKYPRLAFERVNSRPIDPRRQVALALVLEPKRIDVFSPISPYELLRCLKSTLRGQVLHELDMVGAPPGKLAKFLYA